jgi:hypothetical protein
MTRTFTYPGIPNPTEDNLLEVVQALKESVEIGQRLRSREDDSFVTLAEFNELDTWVRTPRWDDLRFPASSATGLGSNPPTFNTTYGTWDFSASTTENLFFTAQLPHGWAEGTTIHPHVHWAKSTSASGDVKWEFKYRWWRIRQVVDDQQTLTVTEVVPGTRDTDTAYQHMISAFDWIAVPDVQISDMITMELSRLGADSEDDYAGLAMLLEFDLHYQQDQDGSIHEFIKSTQT